MAQPISSTDVQLLHKEIETQGDLLETTRLELNSQIDELKLEVETLRRVLFSLQPDLARVFNEVRSELVQSFDPETRRQVG